MPSQWRLVVAVVGMLLALSAGRVAEVSLSAEGRRVQATERHATKSQRPRRLVRRSASARRAFMRMKGYPHGRPGYVIDHIVPLACGGPATPANMQWQTVAEAKAKDRVERRGCW
jgi:hypothetical protein